jgi:hypothetical protein
MSHNDEEYYAYFSQVPQTNYVYDTPYQEMPARQPTGLMDFPREPSLPRRHRLPQVMVKSKSQEYDGYRLTGYNYQISQHSPYIYWYPNPMECRDLCGTRTCDRHYKRMNDYRMCRFCQSLKNPQLRCWDAKEQRCTQCTTSEAGKRCEDLFGCANPNGWMQDRVAPIDPKYTGCRLCE